MQLWKREEPCLVSVVCITYNQEGYIRDAVEGFLMQETNFPFEIIIHDDASTDNTPEIIKEYHSRYPDIIKPIFQKENQYSKGEFKPSVYAAGYSSGEYIALCEGDDYWISSQKLQIQIEAMQKHPELDISFHSAYFLRDGIRDNKPSYDYGYDQTLYLESILSYFGFAPTASFIVRKEVMDNLPDWFYDTAPVGDFFLQIYGAKRGGALYINKPMSIYRVNAKNSWTVKCREYSVFFLRYSEKMLESLQLLEKEFICYSAKIKIHQSRRLCDIAYYYFLNGKDDVFRECIEDSVGVYSFYSRRQRMLYVFRMHPSVLRLIRKLLRCIKKGVY